MIFGARLAAKTTRLEITDTVFARNIRNYARQCVFHALLLGHISADDLRESTDIWRLVTATGTPSAGASPRAHVRVRDTPGGRRGRHDRDRPRDRHLPGGRRAAERAMEYGDRARRHRVRPADIPRRQDRGVGKGRAAGRPAGRPRLPDRRVTLGGRDHAPADGAERGPTTPASNGRPRPATPPRSGPIPRQGPRPRPSPPTGPSAGRPRPGCRCSGSCSSASMSGLSRWRCC